jgi:pyruvate oxidase
VVSEADPLVLRVLGSIGNRFAPKVVSQADLIVILGSGFRQRNLVPDVDKIQVDIDAARVGKTFPVRVGVVGDAGVVVRKLLEATEPRQMDPEFAEMVRSARQKHDALIAEDGENRSKPIYPGAVIQALKRHVKPDAVICSDVGDHTYWFYKRFVCEGQTTLLCANMAGMGFGVPAGVACQMAQPERQVVVVTGDGGFGMVGMDFTTAVRNGLPLTVVVFNDRKLKNIGKEQDEFGFPQYRVRFPNPDFAGMARSAGGRGIRVEEPGDLDRAVGEALASQKPALVEVIVDPEVYIKAVRRV